MELYRSIIEELKTWKRNPGRKPLILKGVRQVGKTWILKEFGRLYYDNVAYFNFDENMEYREFFTTTPSNSILIRIILSMKSLK